MSLAVLKGAVDICGFTLRSRECNNQNSNCIDHLIKNEFPSGVEFFNCYSPGSHSLLSVKVNRSCDQCISSNGVDPCKSNDPHSSHLKELFTLWSKITISRFHTILALKSNISCGLQSLEKYVMYRGLFPQEDDYTFGLSGFKLINEDFPVSSIFNVQESWNENFNEIVTNRTKVLNGTDGNENITICIAGPKNTGKSSLSRYLVNRFLTRGQRVAYLECDPGQPEFTPAGLLSLNIITTPLLGPSYSHPRKPHRSLFFGSTTSQEDPERYISYIGILMDVYRRELAIHGIPLLINTHGWVKGLGFDILLRTLQYVNPKYLFQISLPSSSSKNLPDMSRILPPTTTIFHINTPNTSNNSKRGYNPSEIRDLSFLSHLSYRGSEKWNFSVFSSLYQIRWNEIRIRCLNGEV